MPLKVSVYFTDAQLAELASRGNNRSGIINRDLTRLYTLYRHALANVQLTVDEACLLVDALNGVQMEATTAQLLWTKIENACHLKRLDQKWKVDRKTLVQKLRSLSETESLALIDAVERLWVAVEKKKENDIREMVKEYFNIIV